VGVEQIFARVRTGDREALGLLYDVLGSRVYGVALNALNGVGPAAEVTTDVFVELWRRAPNLRLPAGALAPWVMLDAHRRAVKRRASGVGRWSETSRADGSAASDELDRPW